MCARSGASSLPTRPRSNGDLSRAPAAGSRGCRRPRPVRPGPGRRTSSRDGDRARALGRGMLGLRSPGTPSLEESQPGPSSSPPAGVGVLQFQKVKKPLWGWESLFCCLGPGGGAGGCAEEVVGGMYKTGPSGPLCQLALPAPLTLHSLEPQGGSGERALIPRTVTALGTLLDSWADKLHSIPEGSRTLDRVLRPIWLPQPPVQGSGGLCFTPILLPPRWLGWDPLQPPVPGTQEKPINLCETREEAVARELEDKGGPGGCCQSSSDAMDGVPAGDASPQPRAVLG
ncbi:uncharacterized protein LOC121493346 [Vulpes lagopus]|uniref:uncharacterized protein LOC121493346 n=1 Tax=Vulpes lagopus TaxID=494514 RepID=UPI001BC9063E|nr:uncharacterized protein LOC121493346 [Vulpes lagopus]